MNKREEEVRNPQPTQDPNQPQPTNPEQDDNKEVEITTK